MEQFNKIGGNLRKKKIANAYDFTKILKSHKEMSLKCLWFKEIKIFKEFIIP